MTNPKIDELAQSLQHGLFASRPTINEAMNYAYMVAKSCGQAESYVLTALHVVLNTVANEIRNLNGEDSNPDNV